MDFSKTMISKRFRLEILDLEGVELLKRIECLHILTELYGIEHMTLWM